jgi:dipeptidyl aminopeptidase/acylaminoacyl peptidase
MLMRRLIHAILALLASAQARADTPDVLHYQLPPRPLRDVVDAPPPPTPLPSPDRKWLLLVTHAPMSTIAELALPELRLAGVRFLAATAGPSRQVYAQKLALYSLDPPREVTVTGLPAGARIADIQWSPDSAHVAFTVTGPSGIALYGVEAKTGRARRVLGPRLSAVLGRPYTWLPDGRGFLCKLVPLQRGPAPGLAAVPVGPNVRTHQGGKAAARTFQDLLKTPVDAQLFEYHARSQLGRVTLAGQVTNIAAPALFVHAMPSPDGRYLVASALHRPFSYRVPAERFPLRIDLYALHAAGGQHVRQIADLPLAETVPIAFDAVRTGPRHLEWRSDADATLCWVEARDGGDPGASRPVRDEFMCLEAPFGGTPRALVGLSLRYAGVRWGSDDLALIEEKWWKTRRTHTIAFSPGRAGAVPRVLFDRSSEDRYADPGQPEMRATGRGTHVLAVSPGGGSIYLVGEGASSQGDQPFVDRLDLQTGKRERLFRSEPPTFEYPLAVLDEAGRRALVRRESPTEPPNFYVRELGPGGHARALTHLPHPVPALAHVQKRLLSYARRDGLPLSGMLYLPPGYDVKRDGPLPLVMWVYPHEFKSADAAGQVADSPYRFTPLSPTSPLHLLLAGYAVLDDPAMPIVAAAGSEPNDSYVPQLVADAEAAVDAVVKAGVADRTRIAIAGHSYGAFTTVNLLAHTRLYSAGIARSGAYNRTLTPFGFQSEERTFWEAPGVYAMMSPFSHLEKVEAPLLIIHGEADNNAGTFPLQSERLFEAMQGLGKVTRLVLLPHEAHGYRARESVMHTLWEETTWLDRYVKRAEAAAAGGD